MADFDLRVCGEFIDVEAPALYDPPKWRSASAPPRRGNSVCSEPEHNNNGDWGACYVARLPSRSATLHKLSVYYKDSTDVRLTQQSRSNASEAMQAPMTQSLTTQSPTSRAPSPSLDSSEEDLIQGDPHQMLNLWPDTPDSEPQYYAPVTEHLPHYQHQANHLSDLQCSTEVKVMEPITTLMLCDLPCRLSILEVIDTMDLQGFSNTYDLIYMPRPKGLRSQKAGLHHNLGYAFVNFITPEEATKFAAAFSDVTFPGGYSVKKSYTKPAERQGYKANWKKHSRQYKSGCCRVFKSDSTVTSQPSVVA